MNAVLDSLSALWCSRRSEGTSSALAATTSSSRRLSICHCRNTRRILVGCTPFVADRELLSALKHVMQGKCSDVVSQLTSGEGGFELLRLLALKFGPVMPNLCQMLMASIYGLANDKCKDFKATVTRVAHIERMSNDVAE